MVVHHHHIYDNTHMKVHLVTLVMQLYVRLHQRAMPPYLDHETPQLHASGMHIHDHTNTMMRDKIQQITQHIDDMKHQTCHDHDILVIKTRALMETISEHTHQYTPTKVFTPIA